MMDMIFSQHDLAWLDDLLPEKEKKKKDDDKKKSKGKEKEKKRSKADDSEEEVRNGLLPPPAGGQRPYMGFSCRACVCRTKVTSTPTTRPAQSPTWTAGTVSSDCTSPTKTSSILMMFSLSGGLSARPPPHAAL